MRERVPSWSTVIAAMCLVAIAFMAIWIGDIQEDVKVERTYRENTRGKLIELLTRLEEAHCSEELDEAAARIRQEIQDFHPEKE